MKCVVCDLKTVVVDCALRFVYTNKQSPKVPQRAAVAIVGKNEETWFIHLEYYWKLIREYWVLKSNA